LASTRATLETLGERLGDNEPENLATQLPEELVQVQPLTAVVLAGADLPDAVYQVHAVFEVLDEAEATAKPMRSVNNYPRTTSELLIPALRAA
jgi:uncharacterized protein (DUF2267 family)